MNHPLFSCGLFAALVIVTGLTQTALAATPAELLSAYTAHAGARPQAAHGPTS